MFDRHISGNLAAHIDGQLTARASEQAEIHLARCPRCRSDLEDVRIGMAMLEHLPVAAAPEGLWTSIEGALGGVERGRLLPAGLWRFAAVAALAAVAAAGVYWQYARRSATQWEVLRLDGSPTVGSKRIAGAGRAGAGEWIETDGGSRARISVGEIGWVDVAPNTRVSVVAARAGEHRLALGSGEIMAKISAPPRLFFVETRSGTAVDLGCEYRLVCDRAGFGLLQVTAGWVSFEWKGRESLVPAGATCRTRPERGPGTPYFDDAPERLVRALESFDFENAGSSALSVVLAESRVRDTLTLWHLLARVEAGERVRVYERMAGLSAPPGGVSREKVLDLDAETLKRWREDLAWTW